jgi:putative lipoic acid-binding regulatory protein
MNTYDLKTVMTYAVSAHFQNGEEYNNYGSTTNKTIIQSHLGEISESHMCFVDHITQECADIADKIIQYYKGLTFKAMGAKINDFEQRVLAIIQSGVVDRRDIGVVASLPKAYFRAVKRDETDTLMRKLSVSSIHIGTVGEDVQGNINILNCSFIQSLQCHVVNAEMSGNIVCFFTKHPAEHWGETCEIKGKVKRHQTSKFHGGKETVLNYVKTVDKV